ncbi:MAG TPA: Mur ligase family protein [Dongiaceae bacterium]|nr:Mur ligase family protein [Dongiaceae bacterium]
MIKKYIQLKLERAVRKYFKKHPEVKLVVVVGSVGKTSTKIAVGTVLSEMFRVRLHEGNHNAELSAPLAILGVEFPDSIRNLGQWMAVFKAIRQRINSPADVDVIVQELGTDGVGQIPHFGTYLKPDIAVVSSVSPEHMEFFKTMDAVAAEELSAANFSKAVLINRDDVPGVYANDITNPNLNTYGTTETAEYRFSTDDYTYGDGFTGSLVTPDWPRPVSVTLHVVGEHSIRAAVAAAAVGAKLGMTPESVVKGLEKVRPVNGRMNILRGLNETVIIDDTYNSSPLAVASALRALYQMSVPQKIAVLGSMNELGDMSAKAHEEVGKLCDPLQLAHVITVGDDAEKYLAPAARANGCHVVSFKSALEAGAYVHKFMEPGAVILFKGSQGGIYLEEAVKVVLHATDEEEKLVRQSPAWLKKKQQFFESLATTRPQ